MNNGGSRLQTANMGKIGNFRAYLMPHFNEDKMKWVGIEMVQNVRPEM